MKKILQIIIFLISILTFSQEDLKGNYCSIPIGESDVTCLKFKENNTFEYSVSGCLGTSHIGTGIFELKNKTLKLTFDKKEQPAKSKVTIKEIKSNSEKIVFEFILEDENGFQVYGNIRKKGSEKYIDLHEKENEIKFLKENLKITYEIFSLGYEFLELELNHNSSKSIKIKMFPAQAKVISEKIFEWNLTEINKERFKTGPKIWNTFRKVKK